MPLDPQAKDLIALLDQGFPKLGDQVTDAAEARAIIAAHARSRDRAGSGRAG